MLLLTSRKSCLMTSRGKLSPARAHNRTLLAGAGRRHAPFAGKQSPVWLFTIFLFVKVRHPLAQLRYCVYSARLRRTGSARG